MLLLFIGWRDALSMHFLSDKLVNHKNTNSSQGQAWNYKNTDCSIKGSCQLISISMYCTAKDHTQLFTEGGNRYSPAHVQRLQVAYCRLRLRSRLIVRSLAPFTTTQACQPNQGCWTASKKRKLDSFVKLDKLKKSVYGSGNAETIFALVVRQKQGNFLSSEWTPDKDLCNEMSPLNQGIFRHMWWILHANLKAAAKW